MAAGSWWTRTARYTGWAPPWSGPACAHAEGAGVLRFEAAVQARNELFFTRLGWQVVRPVSMLGAPHVVMRWPIGQIAALVAATKAELGGLLSGIDPTGLGGPLCADRRRHRARKGSLKLINAYAMVRERMPDVRSYYVRLPS